jgi:hypothetical protein
LYHGAESVKCPSCGHEIARNAIVCYRCGASTAAPPPVEAAATGRRGGRRWLLVVLVVAAVLGAALVVGLVRHLL